MSTVTARTNELSGRGWRAGPARRARTAAVIAGACGEVGDLHAFVPFPRSSLSAVKTHFAYVFSLSLSHTHTDTTLREKLRRQQVVFECSVDALVRCALALERGHVGWARARLHAWCDRCDADATARSGEGHDQFSVATDVAVLGTCDIAVAQLLLDEHLRGGVEDDGRGATDSAFAHGGATESLLPKWGRWRHAVVTLVESAMEEDTWCAAEAALLAEDVGGARRRGFAVLTPASALRRIEACDAELTRGLAKGELTILSSSSSSSCTKERGYKKIRN